MFKFLTRAKVVLSILPLTLLATANANAGPISADYIFDTCDTNLPPLSVPDGTDRGPYFLSGDAITSGNTFTSLVCPSLGASDFSFSFRVTPSGGDDDTVGALFGYQDLANHYRLGFERGGSGDGGATPPFPAGGTGARGLWLVREQAGVGQVLFSLPSFLWIRSVSYDVLVSRAGNSISFSVTQVGLGVVASQTIVDTTFIGGAVGIYTESQAATWEMFDVVPRPFIDSDGDGVPDDQDNCLAEANADQLDTDGDGSGDACDADLAGAIVLSADANMISGLDPSLTAESVSDLAIRPSGAPQFFENLLGSGSGVFVDQYNSGNRGARGGNEQIRNFYSGMATVGYTAPDGDFTATDLTGVDLLISNVPTIAYTGDELTAMSDHLAGGGTIMFLGGEGQNFDGSTVIINNALAYLGSSMVLEDNYIAVAGWPHLTTSVAAHPLMAGVDNISIAVSGSVANGTSLAFWIENQINYAVLAIDGIGTGPCASLGGDVDSDTICGNVDNCPDDSNLEQDDFDGDLEGDACDTDDDNDGVSDSGDNCQFNPNPLQGDADGDGIGDQCDTDIDGDGVLNDDDNCSLAPNPFQEDLDGDGLGDACDTDDDNDTILDEDDNCPVTANTGQEDLDGDSIGDACDADVDGDGIHNDVDNCQLTVNPSQDDTDQDGDGDACDPDDDNDGIFDGDDNCPLVANAGQGDVDGDGIGDACDGDFDGDGVDNIVDNCPNIANASQNDWDGDGLGDACDGDIDNDGVGNSYDVCAQTPLGEIVDTNNGCSIAQLCPCEGPRGTTTSWKNHGKYVSCTAHASEDFVNQGLITETEKDAIMSEAGQSSCGSKK